MKKSSSSRTSGTDWRRVKSTKDRDIKVTREHPELDIKHIAQVIVRKGLKPVEAKKPIHPGEILHEEFMKPMAVSINALARKIAVPLNRVSDIVNGKRSITADTALRLGKYFGVSPEVWLNLQVDYDLRVAKRTTWLKAEPRVRGSTRSK